MNTPDPATDSILSALDVTLSRRTRPSLLGSGVTCIEVRLVPQVTDAGTQTVSFAVPFAPGDLETDASIRVLNEGGEEVPAFTEPLVHWWMDRTQATLRSVLVQFQMDFPDDRPRSVTLTWDATRKRTFETKTPIPSTRVRIPDDRFTWHAPKILALLPPEYLCASLLAWQQVPASRNDVAPWFDEHLQDQFPGSLPHISDERYAPHLYDRPATYAKLYIRHGQEAHLRAALRAADFYVDHLGDDGFFVLKPGDYKYVYAEGAAILFMLTGDGRYRDAVLRGLRAWAAWSPVKYAGKGFWTERHTAFGMAAYLHAYALTGNAGYLDAAIPFFEGVFELQTRPLDGKPPDGAWVHTAESHGDGNGWTTSPWMSALLMDSIWKLWMFTNDPRCPASLAMYAKFIDRHAVTPDRKRLYYMANSPGRGESINPEFPPHHLEACYMLAMGYYLSGGRDASLRDTIDHLWPPLLDDNANTPPRKFTWRFRETSMLIWFLEQAERG